MNQQSSPENESTSDGRSFEVHTNRNRKKALPVSTVTDRIQSILENGIGDLWVKGEISDLSFPDSGHVYFQLKDEKAVLPVVLFRRYAREVEFDLKDGLEVRLRGRVSAYQKRGTYQIKARELQPLGKGALQLAFQQLFKKLHEEGLFEDRHKQSLPFLPEKIGVITSATGAAVRDIIRTIRQRYPPVHLLLYPVSVQGDQAKEEIARAIRLVNQKNLVDVIITGRGGGSLEDLWAFNEEIVARAIFESNIPIISAVGHEVDTTISDLVADRAVATPTAAGQTVVPEKRKLMDELSTRIHRVHRTVRSILESHQQQARNTRKHLIRFHPKTKLDRNRDQLLERMRRIHREMKRTLDDHQTRLSSVAEQLDNLSPLNVLKRGYSITRKSESGNILKQAKDLSPGDNVETRLANGSFLSTVQRVDPSDTDGTDEES